MEPMKERRKEIRLPEENRVAIVCRPGGGPGDGDSIQALTQDLSLGGARVLTHRAFAPGAELVMTVCLSKSKQVARFRGLVRWVKNVDEGVYEIGVEFMHRIPGDILTLISHLFRKHQGIPTKLRVEASAETRPGNPSPGRKS